jgi:predicted ester cyclase
MGRPPTGRPVNVTGIDIFRIVDGQVTDRWGVLDMMAMNQQLASDKTA